MLIGMMKFLYIHVVYKAISVSLPYMNHINQINNLLP